MRRPLWIPWRWWRRAGQLALLAAFLWLFRRTESTGADVLPGGENLFFRFDPLVAVSAMLAGRDFLAAFWPAAVVVGMTLLLGRFFCGWICPLGTLLDVFSRLARPLARRTNAWIAGTAGASPRCAAGITARQFRFVLLFAVLVAAALAFPLVGWVDPFALLFRGLTFWVDPLFFQGADAAFNAFLPEGENAEALRSFVSEYLLPFHEAAFRLAGVSAALLGAIFLLEFVARRFWCRFLCPAGALFSLFSFRPLLKRVPAGVCGTCGQCEAVCRMRALHAAESQGGQSHVSSILPKKAGQSPSYGFSPADCTLCMDCVDACPKGIAGFAFRWKKRAASQGKRAPLPVNLSRRALLAGAALGAAAPTVVAAVRHVRPRPLDPFLLRPPGAPDEAKFLGLCVRCGECMKVCPTGVLQPCAFEAGLEGVFSPRLLPRFVFERSYCEFSCTLCGQVCPTGAIPRLGEEEKHARPMGKAYFDHSRCLPWAENISCVRCEEMCPVYDKAIKLLPPLQARDKSGAEVEILRPYVERELCVGCGICESNCPLPGESAVRVRRLDAPDPGTETQPILPIALGERGGRRGLQRNQPSS